jgi:hypothetical protein
MAMVRLILIAFFGLPFLISVWWLILFNTRAVNEKFAGKIDNSELIPAKLRCPLPLAIVAGVFLLSAFCVVLMPLFGWPTPLIVFGHLIGGRLGTALFFLMGALSVISAIGLLKLKDWSYPLIFGLEVFGFASGLVTFLSPNYGNIMRELLALSHFGSEMSHSPSFTSQLRFGAVAGFLCPVFVIGILLFCRKSFLAAASGVSATNLKP